MQEKNSQPIKKFHSEKPMEEQANSKENASSVLFERLNNPIIRKQVIDLFCDYQEDCLKENPDFVPKTRQQVSDDFEEKLKVFRLESVISPESESPYEENGRVVIPEGWRMGKSKEKPTAKQWEIAEAHERGHRVRPLWGNKLFRERFEKAFDTSAIIYPESEKKYEIEFAGNSLIAELEKMALAEHIKYVFEPGEVVERMSQLKNYFGMRGSESFTKEHLAHARKHYIEDTGMDNNMAQFFQAITPEKEDAFIELINSAGI
jgi:hypothetical protein